MVLGDEGRLHKIEILKEEVEAEILVNDKKREELENSSSQFDELRNGLDQMITQLDIDFIINTNSDLMESLGAIEDRLNELIAAKVNFFIFDHISDRIGSIFDKISYFRVKLALFVGQISYFSD